MIAVDNFIQYPKRLIEVDLPIRKISEHARREKSIRHGHISTLHIWWARRPLAACRAVLCAALWPDPADPLCPPAFIATAKEQMNTFWNAIDTSNYQLDDPLVLRQALLDFIADFANWDHSTDEHYLSTARALTESAHVALGGQPGTRPLVVDPFAGGGSIPLEALRVGADAFASDLNPVAVLLNKVVLEYIPKYGKELADEVKKWGKRVEEEAEKELAQFYPKDPDGAIPIAYLWARTVTCEDPSCGAEVPLIRSMWLARKNDGSIALQLIPDNNNKKIDFEIINEPNSLVIKNGTVSGGSATCPLCGYTIPANSLKRQLNNRKGGTDDARLVAIRKTDPATGKRAYRLPNNSDISVAEKSIKKLNDLNSTWGHKFSLIPDESLPPQGTLGFRVQAYGIKKWANLFTPRQMLSLVVFSKIISEIEIKSENKEKSEAIKICLSLILDRLADFNSSLCVLNSMGGRGVVHTFGRQALPMVWDFMETNPFNEVGANFQSGIDAFFDTISHESGITVFGNTAEASATKLPLPDDSSNIFFTDPPYYDAVPYADLSEFFHIWLKRSLFTLKIEILRNTTLPKDEECIVDPVKGKDKQFFEKNMAIAMSEGRRILSPNGIGTVVFAHKSTSGWEAMLKSMIDAGWIITASWPIDTERPGRLRAQNSAALASSIHLVCRPRENPDGSLRTEDVGDWGTVLKELPPRIHEWMARLSSENVVGADAIFACLGPALEIYSRYSRVEKVSGDVVTLGEYLEHVWATVSREALSTIFKEADTEGFEADARLTAIWLWTVSTGNGEKENGNGEGIKSTGYAVEYDTARKLVQGLGAHPEQMPTVVEVKGSTARLLPVRERTEYLFAKTTLTALQKNKVKGKQLTLDGDSIEGTYVAESLAEPTSLDFAGTTTLDQVHYAMLLFATGKGDALGRFLKEDIGREIKFAKLAQALSALYPAQSEEKRWVDGVLARKKSLGF